MADNYIFDEHIVVAFSKKSTKKMGKGLLFCKELKFTVIHPNNLIFLCTSAESRNIFQLIIIHQLLRDLGYLQDF